jgi:NifU-like protein involved in Fe-S cluster formation
MTALEDIYSQRILELAANSPRGKRLDHPQATATAHSKLCGSTITLDIRMHGDRIVDYGQQIRACLLGQSSAAVVAAHVVGSTSAEIRDIGRQMRAMLKEGGPPPAGKWHDLAALEPVRDVKGRHASTLLVFDALEKAIGEIEAKRMTLTAPVQEG